MGSAHPFLLEVSQRNFYFTRSKTFLRNLFPSNRKREVPTHNDILKRAPMREFTEIKKNRALGLSETSGLFLFKLVFVHFLLLLSKRKRGPHHNIYKMDTPQKRTQRVQLNCLKKSGTVPLKLYFVLSEKRASTIFKMATKQKHRALSMESDHHQEVFPHVTIIQKDIKKKNFKKKDDVIPPNR